MNGPGVETPPEEEVDVLDGDAVEEPDPETETKPEPDPTPETNGNGSQATAVARRSTPLPLSKRDPVAIAKHFAASGYFRDASQMSQAVVKIVAGEELGYGPMTAMSGIHIIEGKPSLSANLLAACVKRHPKYDYRVVSIDDTAAELRFLEDGEELGGSKFTIEQAQRAGLVKPNSGWAKYPEAMLFARALSQGVRWHCPDVTAGQPAYTPEELGADVDERGEVVTLPARQVVVEQGEAEPAKPTIAEGRAVKLADGMRAMGLRIVDVDMILGTAGIDASGASKWIQVLAHLEGITPDEADALDRELEAEVDRRAAKETTDANG